MAAEDIFSLKMFIERELELTKTLGLKRESWGEKC